MKATNLSISIPNSGCSKNCPYCVSKMTGFTEMNRKNFFRNLPKVRNFAERAGITSVLLTGKGEPLQNSESLDTVRKVYDTLGDYFPIEIQTNGLTLVEHIIDFLYEVGVNTVAISIDDVDTMASLHRAYKKMNELGMTIRLTVNLVPGIYDKDPKYFFEFCKEHNIHQLSFRRITVPTGAIDTEISNKTQNWINENIDEDKAEEFLGIYKSFTEFWGMKVMELPYGAVIYVVDGVSTTYFDYCVQDNSSGDDIRSLIYYEDGHLATTWYGSNYGRIF